MKTGDRVKLTNPKSISHFAAINQPITGEITEINWYNQFDKVPSMFKGQTAYRVKLDGPLGIEHEYLYSELKKI